ncbi:uncharacterized protein SCHCODRAFT_02582642 [Schizophyllum commune H4-8]|nr:uncharacterized protein SCHCODRAFT_02582642 [Schizophyllum commune H4-8]KAI5890102.1 hypothetical protein SCHCODRAFT_02582642 [Schizophyllum commune H4-8]
MSTVRSNALVYLTDTPFLFPFAASAYQMVSGVSEILKALLIFSKKLEACTGDADKELWAKYKEVARALRRCGVENANLLKTLVELMRATFVLTMAEPSDLKRVPEIQVTYGRFLGRLTAFVDSCSTASSLLLDLDQQVSHALCYPPVIRKLVLEAWLPIIKHCSLFTPSHRATMLTSGRDGLRNIQHQLDQLLDVADGLKDAAFKACLAFRLDNALLKDIRKRSIYWRRALERSTTIVLCELQDAIGRIVITSKKINSHASSIYL